MSTPSATPVWGDVGRDLRRNATMLGSLVAVLWVAELVSWFLPIDAFGVHPHDPDALVGILVHPLLHGDVGHVASNTIGLLLFGGLVVLKSERAFYLTVAASTVLGGAGIWLLGAPGTNHIGASGVVFGLFGFLLTTGWFERRVGPILLSLLVFALWGGTVFGVLPGRPGISWEAHLLGFASGIATAWVLGRRARRRDARRG